MISVKELRAATTKSNPPQSWTLPVSSRARSEPEQIPVQLREVIKRLNRADVHKYRNCGPSQADPPVAGHGLGTVVCHEGDPGHSRACQLGQRYGVVLKCEEPNHHFRCEARYHMEVARVRADWRERWSGFSASVKNTGAVLRPHGPLGVLRYPPERNKCQQDEGADVGRTSSQSDFQGRFSQRACPELGDRT